MSIDKIDFVDEVLTCLDCGREFIFTAGEQRYFWSKGLSEPKRCKACRISRRRTLVKDKEGWNDESDNSTS